MYHLSKIFIGDYRFGFNGQEKDNEIYGDGNEYDYGFRIYNPRLGKFLSVDPLTKSFPWYTPYQFAGNMPIVAIDLDGLEEYIVHQFYDNEGRITKISMTYYTNKTGDVQNSELKTNDGSRLTNEKVVTVHHYFDGSESMTFSDALSHAQSNVLKKEFTKHTEINKQSGYIGVLAGSALDGKDFTEGFINVQEETFDYTPKFKGIAIDKGKSYTFISKVQTGLWDPTISDPVAAKKDLKDVAEFLKANKDASVTLYGNFQTYDADNLMKNPKWKETTYSDKTRKDKGIPSDITNYGDYMSKRANNVKNFLVKEFGVDPNQIKTRQGKAYADTTKGQSVTITIKR